MAMAVTQVRLPEGLVKEIDNLVKKGFYATKSDVVRDAVRRLALEKMVGIIPNKGDSVREVRKIRKNLSRELKNPEDVKELNKLIN